MPHDKKEKEPLVEALKITATQRDLIKNAYVRIAVAKQYMKQFEGIGRFLHEAHTAHENNNAGYAVVYDALIRKLNHAYSDFFMLSNLFPDLRKDAEDMAKKKCGVNMSLGHLGDPEGKFDVSDSAIREAIEAALKARED
jgi:hypothetical protein